MYCPSLCTWPIVTVPVPRLVKKEWNAEKPFVTFCTVCLCAYTLFAIVILIVIVISRFMKRYSKAKRTRAPAYSRALQRIKGGFPTEGGQEKIRSDFQNTRRGTELLLRWVTFRWRRWMIRFVYRPVVYSRSSRMNWILWLFLFF